MKAAFASLFAATPPELRREPTTGELDDGIPCGPFSRPLWNGFFFRLSQLNKEVTNLLVARDITPSESDSTQLLQAIDKSTELAAGSITFYVHSSSGNDANSGAIGSPLQTIHEALNRGKKYRAVTVLLKSDVTLTTALPVITGTQVYLKPDTGTRALTFGSTAWTDDGVAYAFRTTGMADIYIDHLNIVNNITETTVSALFQLGGGQILMSNLAYTVVSGSAKPLIRTANHLACNIVSVTYNSTAGGLFLYNVAYGGDPNLWPYRSNLTTI